MKLENKNILLILHFGALGGAQRQALGLGKYLVEEKKCNVDLLLMHSDFQTKEFSEFVKHSKIRNVFHFGESYLFLPNEFTFKNIKRVRWNFNYINKLRKGLKSYNYSLIIPYLNQTSKLAYFLYKVLPTVKFTFWHQLGLDSINKDWIEYIVRKDIPCVIGNAPNCFDIFKKDLPISENKFHLLPQNITLEKKKLDGVVIKENYNIPKDTIVIGMIAHYRKDKYFDLLLDAFHNIEKNTSRKVHLVFLGNKKNIQASLAIYNHLKERVISYNLQGKASVLSNVAVEEILEILDISVLMSQIEGMPNSVMEYMLYGLPAIVSDHPGCKQLLENSEYLIANDQKTLENKLLKLIENDIERLKEGKQNSERIKKFNLPNYVSELEKIISKYL